MDNLIPMFIKYYLLLKIEIIFILFLLDLLFLGLMNVNRKICNRIKFKLVTIGSLKEQENSI